MRYVPRSLLLPVLLLCVLAPRSQAAPGSRLQNGGFEAARTGGLLEAWSIYQENTLAPGEIALDAGHGARRSARFRNATHPLHQVIPVRAGEVYTFRCRIRTRLTGGGAGLGIHWLTAEGKWVFEKDGRTAVSHNRNLYGIAGWREAVLANVAVPEGAVRAWVEVGPVFGPKGEFWVDDVSMVPVPRREPQAPYRATVTVGRMPAPPTLDGRLDDPAWERVTTLTHFSVPKLRVRARRQTSVKVAYDAEALYLGIRCEEPAPDKVRVLAAKRDDSVWADDCVEVFLAPDGPWKRQYHLVLNPAGTQYDAGERWDRKSNIVLTDLAWNPEWRIATASGDGAWTAEARVPFADLGRQPAEGERWGLNITRHRAEGEEYSSWAPLDEAVFQRPDWFGEMVFAVTTPAIRSFGVSADRAGVAITNPTGAPAPCSVQVERADGPRYWRLAGRTATVAPGAEQTVSLSLGEAPVGMVWTTVSAGGRVLYREGHIPGTEYAAIGWFDPDGVLGNKLYVASDLRSFKPFQTTHNFEGGAGGPQLVRRAQKAVDLVFELPAGIRATHVVEYIINWMYWQPVKPAEATPFTREGKPYVRTRFDLPAILSWSMNPVLVFFETSLPPGRKLAGSCYLQWDTGRQPPRALEIETIAIGRTPPLKRFFNGIYYAEAELLLTWLPDIGRVYPRLGLNRVEIDPKPGACFGPGGEVTSREPWFGRLVEQARRGGLFMATAPCQSTPFFQNWTATDPEARALNVRGEPVTDSRWAGTYSLCPLYRGKHFQEHLRAFTEGPAFRKWDLSWLAIDLELWTTEAWNEGCFCERCLAAFREYAAHKHPGEALGDPRRFIAEPSAHPRERKAWGEFREWSVRDLIRSFREPLAGIVAGHGQRTGPKRGLVVSEWRGPSPALFGMVDYFEINLYHKPVEVVRRLGNAVRGAQGRHILVGTPSPGQNDSADAALTPEDMRYSIFECAAAGTQGMIWYCATAFDALKLKRMVEGIRTIRPFEEIILDGNCRVTLPCQGAGASARGVVLGSEALAIVRAYEDRQRVDAVVTLPARQPSVVRDCFTGQRLGTVTPRQPRLKVPITRERARLLYVGPEQTWARRAHKR